MTDNDILPTSKFLKLALDFYESDKESNNVRFTRNDAAKQLVKHIGRYDEEMNEEAILYISRIASETIHIADINLALHNNTSTENFCNSFRILDRRYELLKRSRDELAENLVRSIGHYTNAMSNQQMIEIARISADCLHQKMIEDK